MIELVIAVVSIVIVYGYLWLKQNLQFWEKRQVPHLRPDSLFFGNNSDVFWRKLSIAENIQRLYNALAPHPFGGIYLFSKPVLLVRDPELIKTILVKDFRYFPDRSGDIADERDPLSLHLFFLGGKKWSVLRQKLTPTFTSGKMKVLFDLMAKCSEEMAVIVQKSALDRDTVDVKDLMARYTTDVISSCAFGLEADSLHNANSEFRVKGKAIFAPTLRRQLFNLLSNAAPRLFHIFRFSVLSNNVKNFFINLVNDTIDYRKQNNVVRNDFLDLLLNVRKDFDFSIPAQCFVFFAAGFETSSSTLTFILYELAEHVDVQCKLQKEIDDVLKLHDGKITYENLQEMHYMDKVFKETSRLYPIVPFLQRICVEDYRFPDSNFIMKKGEMLFIPIYGLHQDAQYYPDPDVFNPENFSEEAINSRPAHSYVYLPFGTGPRHCIGQRFGEMQVKLALTTIMREYSVTISSRMKLPVQFDPSSFIVAAKDDILLDFHKRSE